MPDAIDPRLLDKRVAERYLRKGRLDDKDYRRHLDALPDLADRAQDIESQFQSSAPARPWGFDA